jgi:hypothetical protein
MNRRALAFAAALAVAGLAALGWHEFAGPTIAPTGGSNPSGGAPAEPLFEEATGPAGIDFLHDPGPMTLYQVPQVVGSGCAFLDFDQDGDLDILFVNQAGGSGYEGVSARVQHNSARQSTGAPTHRLFQQTSAGRFVDVTKGSGLDVTDVGIGVSVGDVNNDGFPDIYLSCYGPDRLFLNRRDGTFADVTLSAGIDNLLWGTSCAFVDFDRDGWLDLFVANYVNYYPTRYCADPGGGQEFCHPKAFVGTPHKLYRNETGTLTENQRNGGEVRFRDVSLSSGIARKPGPGLGVVAADFDGDRWPDFFVANDGAANFLWINQHDGTFSEEAVLRGAAYDLTGHPQANMGIAVGDVDGDGRLDLLVTHFDGEMNALYLNKSSQGFEENAGPTGLGGPSLSYTSWGTAFFDIDHDGDLDLAVVNGRVKRAEVGRNSAAGPNPDSASGSGWEAYAEPNQLFLNDGAGRFSELRSPEPFCAVRDVARGLAVGDVDNDGDLDVLVTTVGGPARLFLNVARKRGHWLQIRAVEPALGGRDAYGALVTVKGGGRSWVRLVNPAFSYLASNDPRVHFGLGDIETIDEIVVVWGDGVEEVFPGGGVDRHLVLRRGEGNEPGRSR